MLIDLTGVPFTQEQGRYNVYKDEIARQTNLGVKRYGFDGHVIDMTIDADVSAHSLTLIMELKLKTDAGTFEFSRLASRRSQTADVLRFEFAPVVSPSNEVRISRDVLTLLVTATEDHTDLLKAKAGRIESRQRRSETDNVILTAYNEIITRLGSVIDAAHKALA